MIKISKEKLSEIQQSNDLTVYVYKFNRISCMFSVEEVKYEMEITYGFETGSRSISQIRVYNDHGASHMIGEFEENHIGYQTCYLEKNDENFKVFKNKTIARLEHLEEVAKRMMDKIRWTLETTQAQLKELKGEEDARN